MWTAGTGHLKETGKKETFEKLPIKDVWCQLEAQREIKQSFKKVRYIQGCFPKVLLIKLDYKFIMSSITGTSPLFAGTKLPDVQVNVHV